MVHIEEKYQVPRDFEGFGEEGFDPKWPNGARIAVSFVLNYEEGGERSILDGGMDTLCRIAMKITNTHDSSRQDVRAILVGKGSFWWLQGERPLPECRARF